MGMDNTIFVYGIAAVSLLMVSSLIGMALVRRNTSAPAAVPVEAQPHISQR